MNEIVDADHPALQAWQDPLLGWVARIRAEMVAADAHPARTVVLLPYAQLMPMAARQWARVCPQGFAPRFETTANWSRSLGGSAIAPTDLQFDTGLDLLTARAMLKATRWAAQADELALPLVEMAHELGVLAAARHPQDRPAWMAQALLGARSGLELQALALESALAQVAVTWAAHSAYASDVLFSGRAQEGVDLLLMLQGFQQEPLWPALHAHWGERARVLPMVASPLTEPPSHARLGHEALDVHDEALQAAALTVQRINEGCAPVALVATDRALIRRVRADLEQLGVSIRDEQGWKLSTSQAGAQVMAALRACARQASSDKVLGWLKLLPQSQAAALPMLEHELRRKGLKHWPTHAQFSDDTDVQSLWQTVQAWREALQASRPLAAWISALHATLCTTGQEAVLAQDTAGQVVLEALHLKQGFTPDPQALWVSLRLSLSDFTKWVTQVLEATSFKPPYPFDEQVVILPMSQMLGRAFGAVVLAGCDEVRLPACPEPGGPWTPRQREALGLPDRQALQAQTRDVWLYALQTPRVDILWRLHDESGEPLLPSPLVQTLLATQSLQVAAPLSLPQRELAAQAAVPPAPHAEALVPKRLSASAYEDLRRCPYRFFALRQLGLKDNDELEQQLDKRDVGLWLHAVLKQFHEASPAPDLATRRTQIDLAAQEVQHTMGLSQDEFLPFMAAWPRLREGYLNWLQQHEAQGMQFAVAETWLTHQTPEVALVGQVDRLDVALVQAHGSELTQRQHLVMDYKTEPLATTKERIKQPFEDTQLAFYAALMPQEVRAAYVNVAEKDGTVLIEQTALNEVREALLLGIDTDYQRMKAGAPMLALGEGKACQFCAARGLCRKDSWAGVQDGEDNQA